MTAESGEVLDPKAIEDRQAYSDIAGRIQQLIDLSGEDLSSAMSELKKALKENPAACSLMLPEDIGQIVQVLQRITGKYLAEKSKPSQRKEKQSKLPDFTKLTPEQQQSLLDEL